MTDEEETCRPVVVTVDGEERTIAVRGDQALDAEGRRHLQAIVDAVVARRVIVGPWETPGGSR